MADKPRRVLFLLATCLMTTIGAPHVKRRLESNGDATRSTVLVAASEEEGDAFPGPGDAERGTQGADCRVELSRTIEDCLQWFEVQWVAYNRTQSSVQQWSAMQELCRQHDHTLLCIHRAFLFCAPSMLELNLIESRIGHQRERMLRLCPTVRQSTTTTTTTTTVQPTSTSTKPPPVESSSTYSTRSSTRSTRMAQNNKNHTENKHTNLKIEQADLQRNVSRHGPQYVSQATAPPAGRDGKQTVDIVHVPEELSNDTHSKLQAKKSDRTRPDTWCQTSESRGSPRCAVKSSQSVASRSISEGHSLLLSVSLIIFIANLFREENL